MSTSPVSSDDADDIGQTPDLRAQIPQRVGQAARQILDPLAQLFVAHGVDFTEAEYLLKEAFFHAGRRELERANIPSNISRVSMSTGLHRKDVKRFSLQEADAANGSSKTRPSASVRSEGSNASKLYTKWTSDPAWNIPRLRNELPLRSEPGMPSFEMLARQVSTDAHPRTMLEELKRLGLAELSDDGLAVRIRPGGFVPMAQSAEMLSLLGDNVSDHLACAVNNILEQRNKHLEQAIFTGNLSAYSISILHQRSRTLWAKVMVELSQAMSTLEKQDAADSNDGKEYRIRVGMYCQTDMPRTGASDENAS